MLKTYPLYIIWSTTPEFLKYEIKTTNILFIDFWKRLPVMTHVVHNTRKDKRSWKKTSTPNGQPDWEQEVC